MRIQFPAPSLTLIWGKSPNFWASISLPIKHVLAQSGHANICWSHAHNTFVLTQSGWVHRSPHLQFTALSLSLACPQDSELLSPSSPFSGLCKARCTLNDRSMAKCWPETRIAATKFGYTSIPRHLQHSSDYSSWQIFIIHIHTSCSDLSLRLLQRFYSYFNKKSSLLSFTVMANLLLYTG